MSQPGIDFRVVLVDTTGTAMGTLTNPVVTSSSASGGGLTNNNAAPSTNNMGVLPALANAAVPAYTEGNQVLLSTDLSGRLRGMVQGYQANAAAIAQNPLITGFLHSDNTIRFIINTPGNFNGSGANLPAAADFRFAVAMGSDPASVTAGNYSVSMMNRHGIPYQIGGHPNVKTLRAQYSALQTDTAVVTVAAGNKIVVTSFLITASNANTVNVSAVLGFGTANTPTTTGVLGSHAGIAPGSGFGRGSGAAMVGAGADDEDLRITSSVATGGFIDLTVSYFVLPS